MKTIKRLFFLVGVLGVFALGFYLARHLYPRWELHDEEKTTVLLEKIQTVAKLVTVEGQFSELYHYKDYWGYDWLIFRKKAILRVQARVSVGYDLSNMEVEARPDEQLLVIKNIPTEPEILAVDPVIDYFDIREGTFNSFQEADYNQLQQNARRFIEEKARDSELLDKAREQGFELLEVIRFMAENAGWRVRFENSSGPIELDELKN